MKTLLPKYQDRFRLMLLAGLSRQVGSSGLQPRKRFSAREEHHIRNAFIVIILGGALAISIIFAFVFSIALI